MSGSWDKAEGNQFSIPVVNQVISDALVTLLETKHLYQKVSIDLESALAKIRDRVLSPYRPHFTLGTYDFRSNNFGVGERARGASFNTPGILLQNVKLFCAVCGGAEAFSPLWHKELSSEILATKPSNPTLELRLKNQFQLFALAYQCQICKSEPVAFLVRRHGWNFILDGRSPMEQVEVPKEIPKTEASFFRDGVIAYQSGKPLAGVLYLRVFLEAFARRQTGRTTRATGEELMDSYAQLVPQVKRSLMPSLKEWYGKLSEVIHAGREDADVFKQASEAIHRHFEFRRLFEIADVTVEATSETAGTIDEITTVDAGESASA